MASDPCLMAIRYELHTVVAELQRNRANRFYSTDLPTDLKPCTQSLTIISARPADSLWMKFWYSTFGIMNHDAHTSQQTDLR